MAERRCTWPLDWAASRWYGLLVEAGADVDKANDVSAPPLSVAAQQGNEAVLRVLIEAGADVNHADVDDVTPLYFAAPLAYEDVVRALIAAGVDVNKGYAGAGTTPLPFVLLYGHQPPLRVRV